MQPDTLTRLLLKGIQDIYAVLLLEIIKAKSVVGVLQEGL